MIEEPTCLSIIYRELGSKEPDVHKHVYGERVETVEVVVKEIFESEIIDRGYYKRAWVKCKDGCGNRCVVRFKPGKVKNKNGKTGFVFGDMEVRKAYRVSGSTLINPHKTLIITSK